jgi:hypothetical protein
METISVIVTEDWSADITRNKGQAGPTATGRGYRGRACASWRDGKVIAGRGHLRRRHDGYDQFWSRAPIVGDTQ